MMQIATPLTTTPAIDVQGISKTFGKFHALNKVSFSVPRQSVFCILGPNGAGKTTLLRILTTVSRPSEGQVLIEGLNSANQVLAVRQLVGVVAQDNHFDRYLTIWHNLTMHAEMHGLRPAVYEKRIQELLERVGLYDRRNALAEELSGGMQRRVALIRALIHEPKILFLDEPTTGLDPQARLFIWETIEAFKQRATVVLTTHYMEEADRLSDMILLLNHGKVISTGTARELKQALSPINRYEIDLTQPKAAAYVADLTPHLGADAQLKILADDRLQLDIPNASELYGVMTRIAAEDVLRFGKVEAGLEQVFMNMANTNQPAEVGAQ